MKVHAQTIIQQEKQKLRSLLIAKRRHISIPIQESYRQNLSKFIKNYLKTNIEINVVLSYCHYQNEVQTDLLHEWLLANQFCLGLPRIEKDDICFYQVKHLDSQLEKREYSMLEPIQNRCDKINLSKKAIVITPGLAFDVGGIRLGSGKGFYDRFFARYPSLYRIGLAYEVQLCRSLPSENHDIVLNAVITEKKMYLIS